MQRAATSQNESKFEVRSSANTGMGYVVPHAWTSSEDNSAFTFSVGEDSTTSDFNFSATFADELFQNGKIRPLHPFAPQPFQAISVYEEQPVVERVLFHENLSPLREANCDLRLISNHLSVSAPASPAHHQQSSPSPYHSFESTAAATINRSVVAKPTTNVVYKRALSLLRLRRVSEEEATSPPHGEPFTSRTSSPHGEPFTSKTSSPHLKFRDLLIHSNNNMKKPKPSSTFNKLASRQPLHYEVGENPHPIGINVALEPSYVGEAHLRRRYHYEDQPHKDTGTPKQVRKSKLSHTPINIPSKENMTPMRTPKKGQIATSPHELHYTSQRARAQNMKKKTFLPYRQGLLACLGH